MTAFAAPAASRVIAVTGASRGIGRACAIALAAPGVSLVLMARNAEELRETAQLCEARGAIAHRFGFDLSKIDEIETRIQEIKAQCGCIDVLVNNAGVWIEEPFSTGDMSAWDFALDVNLKATMHLTRHALEGMPEGGAIVFIASTASRKVYANGTNYCAAKHGLMGFAGALFEDVRERGIKVSSVLPGVVNTDMHASDPKLEKPKMIQPEDVAAAVAFIVHSPANVCPTEIALQPQKNPKTRSPA